MRFVYLDHAALTPVDPDVLEEMRRAMELDWGHPSSVHTAGRRARARMEEAQDQVAAFLGCPAGEIEWVGSGTEGVARAIAMAAALSAAGPVVCSRIEHPSVLDEVTRLGRQGRAIHWLEAPRGQPEPPTQSRDSVGAGNGDGDGAGVGGDAALVVFSPLNHELGTAPAAWARPPARGQGWSVIDAVQAAAWIDLRPIIASTPRSFVVVASHKLGGPPGAAAIRVPAAAGQRRPPQSAGMPPWLSIVGMGLACERRRADAAAGLPRVRELTTSLLQRMQAAVPSVRRNGGDSWLGPILSVSVPGIAGRALETALDLRGVCISRTAACQQDSSTFAPAVRAAYPDEPDRAVEATRWSLGLQTSGEDLDAAFDAWKDAVTALGGGRNLDLAR